MATPHVAGAVALLWSAQPQLRNDIEATEAILNESAVPLSSTGCDSGSGFPNNIFGYGRLDVKAAVDYALLRTTAVSETSSAVSVKFYAGLSRKYRLEYKVSTMDSDWAGVPGVSDLIATADGETELTDPNVSGQEQRYYRVRIVN
jgi:subtilisin family serine protease